MITQSAIAMPVIHTIGSPREASGVVRRWCVRPATGPRGGISTRTGAIGDGGAADDMKKSGLLKELLKAGDPATEPLTDNLGDGVHNEREREQDQAAQKQDPVVRRPAGGFGKFDGDVGG